MLKEQKKLEKVIVEKQAQIDAQVVETDRLKKMNKILNQQMANLQSKSKLMAMLEDRDMDTPSSEDSSPKSSFSTKATKIEIKSRSSNFATDMLMSPDSSTDIVVTVSPATTTTATITNKGGGSSKNQEATKKVAASEHSTAPGSSNVTVGGGVLSPANSSTSARIRAHPPSTLSLPYDSQTDSNPAPSNNILSPTSTSPKKPPIPSRAGVNRKLQKTALPSLPPPPPPPRSSSASSSPKKHNARDDKVDSGRESDDQNMSSRLCLNVNDPAFEYTAGTIINSNSSSADTKASNKSGNSSAVNFLASSSPKRHQEASVASSGSGRGTTKAQKNFDEYRTQNDSIKNKTSRQKTILKTSNVAEGKENNNNTINSSGDRTAPDEGFSSSHEDHVKQGYDDYLNYAGLNQKSVISPTAPAPQQPNTTAPPPPPLNNNNQIRTMTNHRTVQKPSDIKNRSKLKSTSSTTVVSNLAVLEEHQVSAGDGQVTTVTYWTEPYL